MPTVTKRDAQKILTLLAGFVFACYVGAFLHEAGHGLGIVLGGDKLYGLVMQVPLPAGHPVTDNPGSFGCVWGGIGFGALAGIPALLLARLLVSRPTARFAVLLVAAFCFLHNGLYLSIGGLLPFSDAMGIVGRGTSRVMIFVLGLPLLAASVAACSRAIQMIGLSPADPPRRWVAVSELGLFPLPGLMTIGAVFAPGHSHGADRGAMALWGASCAAIFALSAHFARKTAAARPEDTLASHLPARWSPAVILSVAWAIVLAVQIVWFRKL